MSDKKPREVIPQVTETAPGILGDIADAVQEMQRPRPKPVARIGKRSHEEMGADLIKWLYAQLGYGNFARARAALVVAQRRIGRDWARMQKASGGEKSVSEPPHADKSTRGDSK